MSEPQNFSRLNAVFDKLQEELAETELPERKKELSRLLDRITLALDCVTDGDLNLIYMIHRIPPFFVGFLTKQVEKMYDGYRAVRDCGRGIADMAEAAERIAEKCCREKTGQDF